MTSLVPQSFIPGYRLQSGTDLNEALANPQWSTTMSLEATTGGTADTSVKIVNTITNITSATAGAGVTIPRSAIGRYLHIINSSANTVNVYAEGDATINGIAGNFGYDLPAGRSITLYGADTTAWLVDDASGGAQEYFVNIAALKAVTPTAGQFADVGGYYTAGDGGGGQFYGVTAGGPYTDNGGTIIVPTGGDGSAAWLRIVNGTLDVKMFGAKGNGVADDTVAIQAALNIAGDIYIPDGTYILGTKTTNGSETGFLRIPNNTRLSGSRNAILKLANDAGNYAGVFIPAVTVGVVAENIQFNGFTIDQNAQNNSTCAITPGVTNKTLSVIHVARVHKSIYVEDMQIINAPGVDGIYLNGPSPASRDARVNRNKYLFLKGVNSLPNGVYDNSGIYINANGFQCNDNYVYNTTGDGTGNYTGGATGIEVHGGNGQICRNEIFRFASALNVVGYSAGQGTVNLNNLVVNENVCTECAAGISVYAVNTVGIKGFEICENLLQMDASLFTFSNTTVLYGVQIILSADSAGDVSKGKIFNNIIQYDGTIITAQKAFIDASSAGIVVNASGNLSDISVKYNYIYKSPGSGIRIQQQTNLGTYDNIEVSDNLISDAGLNTPFASLSSIGIIWAGTVTNSRCLNNQILNTTAALTVADGVRTTDLTNATFVGRIDDGVTPGVAGNTLTIESGLVGTVAIGQLVTGSTIAANTRITARTSATVWTVSGAAQNIATGSSLSSRSFLSVDQNICQTPNTLVLRNRYGVATTLPLTQTLTYSNAASGSTLTLVPSTGIETFLINYDVASPAARNISIETTLAASQYVVPVGKTITVQLVNTSGGTTANITFLSAVFEMAATNPITLLTSQRVQFQFTFNGSKFVEVFRTLTVLTGSATYDPPSLVNGTGTTTNVSVTGAALGDFVTGVSFSNDLQGIITTGWVSAANTVSVRFQNNTGIVSFNGTVTGTGTSRTLTVNSELVNTIQIGMVFNWGTADTITIASGSGSTWTVTTLVGLVNPVGVTMVCDTINLSSGTLRVNVQRR